MGACAVEQLVDDTQILTEYLLHSVRSTVQSTLAILTSVRPENSFLERSSHVGARFLQWPHLQKTAGEHMNYQHSVREAAWRL